MNNDDLDLTHKVRESIYQKIKDMSSDEIVDYIKKESKKIDFSYNLTRKNISVRDYLTMLNKRAS